MRPINPQFADFIRMNGITPPDYAGEYPKPSRFDVRTGKINTAKSGWCVQFDDNRGVFGDWSTGLSDVWHSEKVASMSDVDRRKYEQEIKKKRAIIENDLKKERLNVAEFLNDEYEKRLICANKPFSKYLNQKGFAYHETQENYIYKVDKNQDLIIPLRDLLTGLIFSIQTIYKDGQKRFASGGEVQYKGLILTGKDTTEVKTLRDLSAFDSVAICEGLATALTVREALNIPVIVAFSGGNLVKVAKLTRAHLQHIKIIVCGDNDTSKDKNMGAEYARKASSVSNGVMVFASGVNGTDFNDDYVNAGTTEAGGFDAQMGLLAVRESITKQLADMTTPAHETPTESPISQYLESANYQVMIVCENDLLADFAKPIISRRNHIHREERGEFLIVKANQIKETTIKIRKDEITCPVIWVAFGASKEWIYQALSCGMIAVSHEELEREQRYGFKRVSSFVNARIETRMKQVMPTVSRFPKVSIKPIFKDYVRGYLPADNIENIGILLEWEGIEIKYNLMKHEIEFISNDAIGSIYELRKDSFLTEVLARCNTYELKTSRIDLYKSLLRIAVNNIYHPVKDWISCKEWDGKKRLMTLINAIKTDNKKIDETLKIKLIVKWMIGAVYVLFEEHPRPLQGVLVLQGGQYSGKTTFAEKLCPLNDAINIGLSLDLESVDSVRIANSSWCTELGEIDATFKKSEIARIKQFITQKVDKYRIPYGIDIENYTRRTAFIASVNPDIYLVDETGNRRFWTIPVETIDNDFIDTIDMQQVWAEVKVLLDAGYTHNLSRNEIKELNEHNANFEPSNPYQDAVLSGFHWGQEGNYSNEMTVNEIAKHCGYHEVNRATGIAFGKVLTGMKLSMTRKTVEGKKHTFYLMPQKKKDYYQ